MYKITRKPFGSHHIVKLTNEDTGEYVSVIPEYGAKVQEIVLKKDSRLISILDNESDPSCVTNDNWHKGEFLIPFPNRIRSGEYEFNGKKYNLDINMSNEENAIHGIMFSKEFILDTDIAGNSITLRHSYDGSNQGYPFPCTVTYMFSLYPQIVSCDISVMNTGTQTLPLGVGWHPYFSLGANVEELELKIPRATTIEVDEKMIPTGEKSEFNDYEEFSIVGDTSFDTGFKISDISAVTSIRNKETDVTIELEQTSGDQGFNYVQIFTPPSRKTIAVEPMTCPANAFNSKESLIKLNSQETWRGSFRIYLK